MFGTLRYVTQNNNPSYVTKRTGDRPPGRRGSNNPHSACERCRIKKLRCSGQKEGCNRCKGLGSTCSYPDSSADNSGSKNREQEAELGDKVGDDRVGSLLNNTPGIDQDSARISLGAASIENASRSDGHDGNLSTGSHTLDDLHDSTNLRPSSSSVDHSSSVHTGDWSTKSDSHAGFGSFSPDGDLQYFDTDLLMSDFIMSECFNLNAPHGEDKLGDDSGSNPSSYTADSGYKSLTAPLPVPRNQVYSSCTAPRDADKQMKPIEGSRSNSIYQNNSLEKESRILHFDPPSQTSANPRYESSNRPRANSTSESCHCLQTTVSMLEDIDMKTVDGRYSSVDVAMNFHQDALSECTYVLTCRNCTARPERMMLMTMIAEKLANLCEKTSLACFESLPQPESRANFNPTSGDHCIVTNSRSTTETVRKPQLGNPSCLFQTMFCGRYRIGRSKDWAYLMRMVIILQVKALCDFLKRIKTIVSILPRRESHLPKIDACEERVRKIIESLWRSI